jgi:AcrR family transcriptional regulator
MTEDEKISTEEKILLATIEAIEIYGIESVTTRKIAETAGTNIASINYYFRTKEDLIERALKQTIEHMLEDVFAELERDDQSLRETMEEVFFYLIDGGRRFPKLTTAHLYRAVMENQYDSAGAVAIRKAYERLSERATDALPGQSAGRVRFLLAQLIGSIMFMLLAPGLFKVDASFKPVDSDRSRALAEHLTEQFFSGLNTS